jgi:dihydroorotate dehydrogenase electron transfer subunit
VAGARIRLVFRIAGRGTALLAGARNGDEIDLLGPLGRPAPKFRGKDILVCGGGIGIPPLLHFARQSIGANRVQAFLGARTAGGLVLASEFRRLGVAVTVATDDGTRGRKALVAELVEPAVQEADDPVVVACGPQPMLADLVHRLDPVPVWGFIEERMGCGTGICYCCALPRKGGGYVRFCQEGPVVLLNEVAW